MGGRRKASLQRWDPAATRRSSSPPSAAGDQIGAIAAEPACASRSFYPPTRSLAPIHSAKGKMESRVVEEGAGDAMGHGGVGMRKEGTVARGRLSIAFIPD